MILNEKEKNGFTLIEVAIVLIIGGILLGAWSAGLLVYIKSANLKNSTYKMEQIDQAMDDFLAINGRLPCPAPSNAAEGAANYGAEACGGAGPVLQGAVPTRSLNVPDEYMSDSWSSRFTYAVTASQTNAASYAPDGGVISVIDAAGNTVVTPAGKAHFVIVSHGPDHIGGFVSASGVAYDPCDATTLDGTNCDNDATFRKTMLNSTIAGPNHYDDIVLFQGDKISNNQVPTGAVMAFDLATCPLGWASFTKGAGRFIIGTGTRGAQLQSAGTGVNARSWNDAAATYNWTAAGTTAGFATWAMGLNELAPHRHDIWMTENYFQARSGGVNTIGAAIASNSGLTHPSLNTGGAFPMDNIPPYIALTVCVKN